MHSFYFPALISLATVCCVMLCVWIWATRISNAGIVDVFWAFNFTIIGVLIWWLAPGDGVRKLWVSGLACLWSLRLTWHLGKRVLWHLGEEEGRYKQLRYEWRNQLLLKFFLFFQAQAVSNIWLAIPWFIMAANVKAGMFFTEYAGAAIWLLAIVGETVADAQLAAFKKNPANKGKVCNKGLWNYSRHPNYFFQLLIWIGVFVMAIGSPYGWLAFISPVSIGYLLFKVTGIPLTEEQNLRSKGDAYRQYQQTTSVFIPWRKKN
ncbi:Steroid 5-alpha reductase family enzyme [Filimonas lacunae]|uniref:Steroid 5-alpha reductase family enzyme n=1 Tax=Filimonas lacunae TaxID=477680 RepID=A0A173MP57_9BACT|nr:DUF1295 domain-containing protein [Filimonas lacunae]BAV09443.1 hypothetical protein FLA_5492 [Filimonas lacunae]SIS73252.1 Steroid 5-alpha reductase family enzyme [Filimonas lacunae]